MAHFLMSSTFWFTHFNESTNQIVVILCCTIIEGNSKFTAPATRLCRGMKKCHAFLTLVLDTGV